jgi:hypothetical protein
MKAWHFLADNGKTRDGIQVEVGQTLRVDPPLEMCRHGLHASLRALDALDYAPGAIVCRVELSGEIQQEPNKLVASERTVLWMEDATRVLHKFACVCAEQALRTVQASGYTVDPRSQQAIAVKRLWLDGRASDAKLSAARTAAWDAVLASSRTAARDAARTAAWSADRDAVLAATWSADRDAPQTAAQTAQNQQLERMLNELHEGPIFA